MLANATYSLQAAQSATADIPILGTAITNYGIAPVSYTHLDVYKRQGRLPRCGGRPPPPWRPPAADRSPSGVGTARSQAHRLPPQEGQGRGLGREPQTEGHLGLPGLRDGQAVPVGQALHPEGDGAHAGAHQLQLVPPGKLVAQDVYKRQPCRT